MAALRVHVLLLLRPMHFLYFSPSSQHLNASQVRQHSPSPHSGQEGPPPGRSPTCLSAMLASTRPPPCTWAFSIPCQDGFSDTRRAQAPLPQVSARRRILSSLRPTGSSPALHPTSAHAPSTTGLVTEPVAFNSVWQKLMFNKYLLKN